MNSFLKKIDEARKAVAGLVVPGLAVLGVAVTEGSDGGTAVTTSEWIQVAIASLATGSLVYAVKNGKSKSPTTSTPEA